MLLLLSDSKPKSNLTLQGTVLLFSRDDILVSTLSVSNSKKESNRLLSNTSHFIEKRGPSCWHSPPT